MKVFNVILCGVLIMGMGSNLSAERVRRANVAGMFYPGDREELEEVIDKCLDVDITSEYYTDKRILGVISPHAGYIYSGPVAGYVYELVSKFDFKTVLIIGPSHTTYFKGAVLDDRDAWKTPLGTVDLDKEFEELMLKNDSSLYRYPKAFDKEHCLEVQVPFLQKILKDFKIVPVLVGGYDKKVCKGIADTLYKLTKTRDDVLIVISSDLSHYKKYDVAYRLDNLLIQDVIDGKADEFLRNTQSGDYEACGAGAMGVLLYLSDDYGLDHNKLKLRYLNSGDTAGSKDRVVGYSAMVFYKDPIGGDSKKSKPKSEEGFLEIKDKDKKVALKLARETIYAELKNSKYKVNPDNLDELFHQKYGAFVTLHKNGRLRGCIGNIIGRKPLCETIQDMAIAAAFSDSRFPKLRLEEFNDIEIEISILSPLKVIKDPDEIVLGTHGVIVKKGPFNQGVFLPQVATDTGWSKDEFMGHLCRDKAGLGWDAWKDKDTEISIFSAIVFCE